MVKMAVEIVRFRLAKEVNEDDFLRASNIMMKELVLLDGFLSRELLKGDDGTWMDLLHWKSMDAALKAAEDVLNLPLCLEYFKLMDEASMEMSHYLLDQKFDV
ncbi:MAG: hypothetical protein SCH66_09415 [Methanolobus sp.]|nr:hypothetical protein [Methanolobus sp.]